MPLDTRDYHQRIDQLQQYIEDQLDNSELDVDIESSAGVLTLTFANESQLIISRQEPVKQLWIAARSGGFHFDYLPAQQRWYCHGLEQFLGEVLTDLLAVQAGEHLLFSEL